MAVTHSTKKIPLSNSKTSAKSLSVEDLVGKPVTGEPAASEKKLATEPVPVIVPKPAVKPVSVSSQPVARPFPASPPLATGEKTQHYPARQDNFVYENTYTGASPGYRARPYSRMRPASPNGNHLMQDANVPTQTVKGFLEIMAEGHGFLRPKFTPSDRDIYISQSQIRKFSLRPGDEVQGQAREPKENERYFGLLKVEKINDAEAESLGTRPRFDDLVPIYPKEMIRLETGQTPLSTRIIDLLSPIGFGQRGMIVSPPKAGKTTILKEIANGISQNYPKAYLMAALIGERPEEVTDLSRSIKGDVIASHFDESPQEQTKVAEIALNRARRVVETGRDVIILLDSITRLARAYNLTVNSSGRTLSGGFDPAALYPAKRFLGAARKCEEGGSLTIIGTALVETGSRMDDLIYEEFKGTGNMELHLNRSLAERRIFPAIDMEKSGTRQEQLLLDEVTMKKIVTLRNMLSLLGDTAERTMAIVEKLGKTKTNKEFLTSLSKGG